MNEPRLPQIDPMTFAALTTLDTFLARASLTRAEHAEANKSLQHLVQTIEALQGAVKQFGSGGVVPGHASTGGPKVGPGSGPDAGHVARGAENGGGRIVAEV